MNLSKADIAQIVADTVAEIASGEAGVPRKRLIRKRLSAQLKSARGVDVVKIGLGISAAPTMKTARARWVGWELINKHGEALASLQLTTIEKLGLGNSSWDEVDGYGVNIAGRAWLLGLIDDADVRRWAKSEDLWWRRAALVATVVLNAKAHGGAGDTKRTLAIVRLLIDDREDMVVKAMSWALRSLVDWDRNAVTEFIDMHDARLAARVKRETRIKLRYGKKNVKLSAL